MTDPIQQRIERLQDKSPERLRIEAKVKVGELTDKLDTVIMTDQDTQLKNEENPKKNIKKIVAWVVLLAAIGAVVFPVIGRGYQLFLWRLSYYVSSGFTGVAVTLGVIAAIWAIVTILKNE